MQRYNVYFAGQILEGHDLPTVRANLGRLFKADETTLDRLFNGERHSLKLGCNEATALKYQQSMKRAGAQPVIREAPTAESAEEQDRNEEVTDLTAASAGELDLCPEGTEVLRPGERAAQPPPSVNAPELEIDAVGQRLSEDHSPSPPAPNTDHLSMGAVGELIPNLASGETPVEPDTSGLELTPEGTDFSDCARPEVPTRELDLSGLDLAPEDHD
jgi:hypothetical protein